MKRFLTLIFFALAALPAWGAEEPVRGYRVIHASPPEFTGAIFTPFKPRHLKMEKNGTLSRLDNYFRIKSKTISGKNVTLEIVPDVPLLGTLFDGKNAIIAQVHLSEESHGSYLYDLTFKSTVDLACAMLVKPHPSGSLLIITVKRNSMDIVTRTLFYKTIFAMGFLSEKPAESP